MTQLSDNLAALLAIRGMNPSSLARETNVSQPTIHRILKGESEDPRTDTLKPIADFFGLRVEDLREKQLAKELLPPALAAIGGGAVAAAVSPAAGLSLAGVARALAALQNIGKPAASDQIEKRRYLQEIFVGGLADADLPGKRGQAIKIFGHRYRFGYCSENVVAEFCILWLRKDPETLRFRTSTLGVVRSMWHLSLCAKDDEALPVSRRHVLFLLVADENGNVVGVDPWADPLVQKLRDEGRVHEVELIRVMDPADGVAVLREIEEGVDPDVGYEDDFFDE